MLFIGVRDSFAQYCVRYWLTDLSSDDPPDSAVRVRVWFALRRADIPLSIPASTVFLTPETPEREARKLGEELERRMKALGSVDLFRGLPEVHRKAIAVYCFLLELFKDCQCISFPLYGIFVIWYGIVDCLYCFVFV